MSDETQVPIVVGVRFSKVGKVYHFSARDIPDLKIGDQVVVETSRGWQLGTVAQVLPGEQYHSEGLKAIDRRATPRDLLLRQSWQAKEADVLQTCKARAEELRLRGIKIVHAEYSFDGSRLAILFSTESEEKYELKSLRGDMQRAFQPAQVELRQIGPRDVAKMMGGMGACGLETRCCSQFLCEFSSISIRMAKEQGISLTPTEITGMCGRLRCCLIYEYEQYTQARALLPKRNRRVMTPAGEAKVLDQIPMRDAVYVVLADETRRVFKRSEIQLIDENGVLTPAMSEAEREALSEEVEEPRAQAYAEDAPPAYTLPPQPRTDGGRSQPRQGGGRDRRDDRRNRPQNRGPRQSGESQAAGQSGAQQPGGAGRGQRPDDRGRQNRPAGQGLSDARGGQAQGGQRREGGTAHNANPPRSNRPPQGRPNAQQRNPNRPKGHGGNPPGGGPGEKKEQGENQGE